MLSIERSRRITSAQPRRRADDGRICRGGDDARPPPGSVADAERRQPVENAELAFTQALVDECLRLAAGKRAFAADDLRGLLRTDIRRRKNDLRSLLARQSGEPAAGGLGLMDAEGGQRHIDVAQVDADLARPASSAASRATLPWLCPCRTSHSRSGQFCSRPICPHRQSPPEALKARASGLCQLMPPRRRPFQEGGCARRGGGTSRAPGRRSGPCCNSGRSPAGRRRSRPRSHRRAPRSA